jgi:hypothetical protein
MTYELNACLKVDGMKLPLEKPYWTHSSITTSKMHLASTEHCHRYKMVGSIDSPKKSNRDLVRRQKNQKTPHRRYRSDLLLFPYTTRTKLKLKKYSPGIYVQKRRVLWVATN